MGWLVWLLIFMFIVGAGIFGEADSSRLAIASDIESGKLILTEKSKKMLERGDFFLDKASEEQYLGVEKRYSSGYWAIDNDLFEAFIAKVWYERARLEMEAKD